MRLIFLGTPEFAVPTLEGAVAAGHEIAAVLTQPDRPKGRGQDSPPRRSRKPRCGWAWPSTSPNASARPKWPVS